MNGKTDFYRTWSEYSAGFGNLSEEFWLGKDDTAYSYINMFFLYKWITQIFISAISGNDILYNLTSVSPMSLRVDMQFGNDTVYAHYANFSVDSKDGHYTLTVAAYTGTAGGNLIRQLYKHPMVEIQNKKATSGHAQKFSLWFSYC